MKKNVKKIPLSVHNPALTKEWHPTKNGKLDITKIGYGSDKKVWWKCKKCGHEWRTKIYYRTLFGYGQCPKCISLGFVNLLLSKEWGNKNTKSPFDFLPGSSKSVWWEHIVNGEKHEWKAGINYRNSGNGCPYCSGNKVCKSNCLKTKLPKIAKEWHPTKNGKRNPSNVSPGSNFVAWWICSTCKYEWKTEVYHRNDGNHCPKCSKANKIILKDGARCASKTEALFYLKYKKDNLNFVHNERYGRLGKRGLKRYDFFFPETNTYVEITGFNKKNFMGKGWIHYLRNIVLKKKYVEKVMGGKFKFICYTINKEEKKYVEKNMKK